MWYCVSVLSLESFKMKGFSFATDVEQLADLVTVDDRIVGQC